MMSTIDFRSVAWLQFAAQVRSGPALAVGAVAPGALRIEDLFAGGGVGRWRQRGAGLRDRSRAQRDHARSDRQNRMRGLYRAQAARRTWVICSAAATVRRSRQQPIALDARDDRRRQAAQLRVERVGGQSVLRDRRRARSAARCPARCRRRSADDAGDELGAPAVVGIQLIRQRLARARGPRRPSSSACAGLARSSAARPAAYSGQRRLERGIGHLVHAQRAHQRMRANAVHERRAPDDDAGLGSAEEFVAAEAADVDAARQGCPRPPAPPIRSRSDPDLIGI